MLERQCSAGRLRLLSLGQIEQVLKGGNVPLSIVQIEHVLKAGSVPLSLGKIENVLKGA